MIRNLIIFLLLISNIATAQSDVNDYLKDFDLQTTLKKHLKFSTVYGAVNGGTSVSDVKTFTVTSGQLEEGITTTPYDYSVTLGIRKIARFGYENKAQTFYDGTESNYSDAAPVGKVKGFEYLFEVDYARQQGVDYINHHDFIRYSSDEDCEGPFCVNHFAAKVEYLKDGFADVEYFELSERYRIKRDKNLSFNVGALHRLAEPYGYDPLAEWQLSNGNLHYTYLAIMEGYTVDVYANEYKDVIGFDYYKYSKKTWLHAWGNLMPWHYNDGSEFSYHNYIEDDQWYDYSGGLIYGIKYNKHLGYFIEGTYNKYWNREWYDFKFGVNYVIF